MLEKFNGLQIFISAILVRYPLSILSSIIQVQHRCHRIYTQSIDMELFNPVNRISDQEIFHFIFAIIKYLGSPVRMLTLARVCVLVQACSVKRCQPLLISREMRRYPVKNNTYLIFMQIIYKIRKILRCAITGGWCIISSHLIPPGSVKRMLRNSHQLDMCISHILHILRQFRCQLTIIIVSRFVIAVRMFFPAARMYFIN